MRIKDVKVFQYTIPLARTLTIHGQKLKSRQGLILECTSERGASGYGEIAPLPGMSRETFFQAREQALALKEGLTDQAVPPGIEQLNGTFHAWLGETQLFPSVRFGFETAVLTMKASAQNVSLAGLIHKKYENCVPVNGLLQGTKKTVVPQAKAMLAQGYRAIKLKVGASDLDEDIEKVRAVSHVIQSKSLLRLDANRAWTFTQAMTFARAIDLTSIEYIEEPFKDISKIPEFYHNTLVPVALDESIATIDFDTIKSTAGLEILIAKPALWGGLERTFQFANWSKQSGIRVIVSSCFETGIGLSALASLAAGLWRNVPVGLDTLQWFKKDLLAKKMSAKKGHLETPRGCLTRKNIKYDLLKEIFP